VDVVVGGMDVSVVVEVAVSVFSGVTGEMTVTLEDGVEVEVATKIGGGMMKGVGVMMPGVKEAIGVQTGKVWGATPQASQEVINIAVNRNITIFFITFPLYTPE
jgi:hypothetical protein